MSIFKWLIEIKNKDGVFNLLIKSSFFDLKSTVVSVANQGGDFCNFYFTSIDLNDLDDEQMVSSHTPKLLDEFNGILYLLHRIKIRCRTGSIIKNDEYDPNNWRSRAVSAEIIRKQMNPSSIYSKILDYSRLDHDSNKNLAQIIRLLGRECPNINWEDLYKVYEIVDHEIGKDKLYEVRPKGVWTNFTHTANHPKTGDHARHSISKSKPPTSPMSLEEANLIILEACRKLIKEKLDIAIKQGINVFNVDPSGW